MSTRIQDNDKNLFIATIDRQRAFELYAMKLQNVINSNVTVESIRVEMDRLINERNIKCHEIDRTFKIMDDEIRSASYPGEELN